MNKLILILLVCTILSTGYLQEISTGYYPQSIGSEHGDAQVLYLPAQQKQPCPKRKEKNDQEEQWIPSYSSRVTHQLPLDSLLQPQALKNDNYYLEPHPDNNLGNNGPSVPERRSLSLTSYQPPESEEDCDDEPATPRSLTSSANSEAIKLIKDCLKRKLKHPPGSSRRSMSGPDTNDSDELSDDNESLETEIASRKAGNTVIKSEIRSKETLLNPRVCYACSTATNPSCWEPDKKTTVKYCTREKSCVTKSFGTKNALTVIRDCADSCEDSSVPGIEPKFNKCKVCHSDLCNGAFSINAYNLVIILAISLVKYTFY